MKRINLLFAPILTIGSITTAPLMAASCQKTTSTNLTFEVDSHVKSYKHTTWKTYSNFTLDCEIENGYQISNAKFIRTSNNKEIEQQYITFYKNKVIVDQQPIISNQKIKIIITTSQVKSLPVSVNKNNFDVSQTSFNFSSDTDLVIQPTSKKYDGKDVHKMTTVHGTFLLCKSKEIVETVYFESSETSQYSLKVNDFIRKVGADEVDNIVVNLKFAEIALENPWQVYATIAADGSGLTTAQSTFNPGDYASLLLEGGNTGLHYVRIADMGNDEIASGGKATFTFEFCNPITNYKSITSDYIQVSAWDSVVNKDYSNSTVHQRINNTDSTGLKTLIKNALKDSASSLKTVKRNFLKTDDYITKVDYYNTTLDTEIFLPGLKNVMSTAGINSWTKFKDDEKADFNKELNTQYAFYKNEVGDMDVITAINQNKFVRKYGMQKPKSYYTCWMATPDVSNIYKAMIFNSKSPSDSCKWNQIGFAPCFCF